jgi:uncharacterized protein (TIGR01244 family)
MQAYLLGEEAGKGLSQPERCACFEMPTVHRAGDVYMAGQLTPEGYTEAQEQGVRTVVNLRTAAELDWDEKTHVERLGMRYIHVPVASSDAMTDDVFARLRELFRDSGQRPILVKCRSAGRVAAAWLAYRVLDDEMSLEPALQEARAVGLRKEDYIRKTTDYVRRMQGVSARS